MNGIQFSTIIENVASKKIHVTGNRYRSQVSATPKSIISYIRHTITKIDRGQAGTIFKSIISYPNHFIANIIILHCFRNCDFLTISWSLRDFDLSSIPHHIIGKSIANKIRSEGICCHRQHHCK